MNIVDGTCENCGQPIRWLTGSARVCDQCKPPINQGPIRAADRSFDKPYAFGDAERRLTAEEIARLRRNFDGVQKWGLKDIDLPDERELA